MRHLPILTNYSKKPKLLTIEELYEKNEMTGAVDENEFDITQDFECQNQTELTEIMETQSTLVEEKSALGFEDFLKDSGRQDIYSELLSGKSKENTPLDRKGKEINEGEEDNVETKQVRGRKTGLS